MNTDIDSAAVNLSSLSCDTVRVAPKISRENMEAEDYEVKKCTAYSLAVESFREKQGALGTRSTNGSPDGKGSNTVAHKPVSPLNVLKKHTDSQLLVLPTDEQPACEDPSMGSEAFASAGMNCSPKASSVQSPKTTKEPQPSSPKMLTPLQPDSMTHADEEHEGSLDSSSMASSRTAKSRVTVAIGPTLRSSERAQKRKEFYSKLEQRQQALDAERNQAVARAMEEQEIATKQLRKNMVFKATPMPNFYKEGPPPLPPAKVEHKKPITHAVSPKIGRRKSNG